MLFFLFQWSILVMQREYYSPMDLEHQSPLTQNGDFNRGRPQWIII